MGGVLAWCVSGAAVTLLIVLWNYVAWRELSTRRTEIAQLARQALFSCETVKKAIGTPYEKGAKNNFEISLAIYRKAAKGYNTLRNRPFYRIPSAFLGYSLATETPELML